MSEFIGTLMAEAERPEEEIEKRRKRKTPSEQELTSLAEHNFRADEPALQIDEYKVKFEDPGEGVDSEFFELSDWNVQEYARERERRIYRARTVTMLRRYMNYSLETGRIPAMLGQEFFASNVTKYRVHTFEDRVIFVHDMETCLGKLDEFSRQVLGRVILQDYEHEEVAVMLGCTRMTVHRKLLEAIDRLTEILLSLDLLSAINVNSKKSCQEGESDVFCVSDCED